MNSNGRGCCLQGLGVGVEYVGLRTQEKGRAAGFRRPGTQGRNSVEGQGQGPHESQLNPFPAEPNGPA